MSNSVNLGEAIGYSDDYPYSEAVRDAIKDLLKNAVPEPFERYEFKVLEVGVERGGTPGVNRLFVRVSGEPAPQAT